MKRNGQKPGLGILKVDGLEEQLRKLQQDERDLKNSICVAGGSGFSYACAGVMDERRESIAHIAEEIRSLQEQITKMTGDAQSVVAKPA